MFDRGSYSVAITGIRRNKTASALTFLQYALACAVLGNVLFLVFSSYRKLSVDPGFDISKLAWIELIRPDDTLSTPAKRARSEAVMRAISSLGGVESVAEVGTLPLSGEASTVTLSNGSSAAPIRVRDVNMYPASHNVASTFGLNIVEGRDLVASDEINYSDQTPPRGAALITLSLANKLWPNESPIGKRVYGGEGQYSALIVGVVRSLAKARFQAADGAQDSIIFAVEPGFDGSDYAIHFKGGASQIGVDSVAALLSREDPSAIVARKEIMQNSVSDYFKKDRDLLRVMVLDSFIILAISLCALGALNTFLVHQRRRSIAIRRALGARRVDIVSMFLVESFCLTFLGNFIGVFVGIYLNVIAASHFGVAMVPTPFFAGIAVLLCVVGIGASIVPALVASIRTPMIGLQA